MIWEDSASPPTKGRGRRIACFKRFRTCIVALLSMATLAQAQQAAQPPASDPHTGPACVGAEKHYRLSYPLPHLAKRLANNEPVTIVALGSSSTAGAGASEPGRSYPARLEALLREYYPGSQIKVVNRGVGGERTQNEMLRFYRDVLSENPDLVLWQAGTNTVMARRDMWGVFLDIRAGINRLKAIQSDVILINLQYAPKVLAHPEHVDMNDLLDVTGRETNVDVFDRYHIMKQWVHDERYRFPVFISPDGLHMNDWSYDCIARLLRRAIVNAPSAVSATR